MSLKEDILVELNANGGTYISGEALAKRFSKTRAAVWKGIKALQKEGYSIDAVTNKGYLLSDENDLIRPEIIAKKLQTPIKILYYPTIDSTNTQAKRLINEGNNETMLLVCDEQTAGRGRQGKTFYSPPMTGIYMTLAIHKIIQTSDAVSLTTIAAVSVCKAVESLTHKNPKIKWVNDVYLNGKKICGILTEAVTDFESGVTESVIIGIGMNINTISFPPDIENASSLEVNIRRSDLIAEIANQLLENMNNSYSDILSYYRSHSMLIGREIEFIQNGKVTPATAIAIDDSGGLVVRLADNSRITLNSGEISIKPITS